MSSLWQRVSRALGASAHATVDRAEEPESMMNQLQRELVEAAGQARLAVNQTAAWRAQIDQRLVKLAEEVDCAGSAARRALEQQDGPMARAAIARKQLREKEIRRARKQLAQADEVVSRHRQRRDRIAKELAGLREKRAVLMQRSRFARSVSNLDVASPLPEPVSEVIARMEEKVTMQEARAQSLTGACEDADENGGDRDANLDEYIRDQSIDAELAKLQSELGLPDRNPDSTTPRSTTPRSTTNE